MFATVWNTITGGNGGGTTCAGGVVTATDTFDCNMQNVLKDTLNVRHVELTPPEIPVCGASVNPGDRSIDVLWNYLPPRDLDYILIARRSWNEPSFETVDTIFQPGVSRVTDDSPMDPDVEAYCYRLVAVDLCGNQSLPSTEVCASLLEAKRVEFSSHLNWRIQRVSDNVEPLWAPKKYA